MPKVSVIVPVYNVEKYLNKCLNSIVNQTMKDIEIIIINDGSPDNSEKIIDTFKEKYPKIIKYYKKDNGGLSSARNYGLSYATGEYISFVDSDDWLSLSMYDEMYNIGKKNDSDIVICDMVDYYKKEIIYHNCTKNVDDIFAKTFSACNKIFKKSILSKNLFLDNIWYEDLNFTTKIYFQTDKISFISKGFYNCNCRDISIMNNNNSIKNLDIIISIENVIVYAKENNIFSKYKDVIEYLIITHILLTAINRVAKQKSKDKKEVLNILKSYSILKINKLLKNNNYKKLCLKKKIIIYLNYHGFWWVSKSLLMIKQKIF